MSHMLSPHAQEHLDAVRSHYDEKKGELSLAGRHYRKLLAHYYNLLIPDDASVLEIGCGSGELLQHLRAKDITGIDVSPRQIERSKERLPEGAFHVQAGESLELDRTFDYIIVSDTINFVADAHELFSRLHAVSHDQTRLLINFHNSLWRPLLCLGSLFSLRTKQPATSWFSASDIHNLLDLSGWEVISQQGRLLCPLPLLGMESLINRWLAPIFSWFCLTFFLVARRVGQSETKSLSVSVVVPARNESGNIEEAILRTPDMGEWTELIFIEGNSTDDTWEKIQQMKAKYPEHRIRIMQQTGKGKGNAVSEAFAVAEGDILMILDADLTMPPEELPKFYEVIASNHAEFANGVRLVYPMKEKAMRFANLCANKAFSMVFTFLLGQSVKDTLCGTKVLLKSNYEAIDRNRSYFGEFDPFGDFDLIFGADKMNLKIADVPIRYQDRTYGDTNISRWRHGVLLLRMVLFAARKLKFV